MNYFIGIDIGTQGTKACLFDENGRQAASSFRKSRLIKPEPGVVMEEAEEQLEAVVSNIKELMDVSGAAPGSVAGIAIDGQMAGVIGVGEDGLAVTPYDSWLDTRCAPQIELMKEKAGALVLEKSGCAPSFNHGPKILWWRDTQAETWQKIRSFVQPGGYAAMRLCGLKGKEAFIDTTYLHFSGFADNRKACWDQEICRILDVDTAKLPRIVNPEDIIGTLTAEMAGKCGLVSGIPVSAGCGDTAASFLAAGAAEEGVFVDVAGTASVFAATVKEFRSDSQLVMGCGKSAVPGLWHPYAYINGGGMNLEWFRGLLAGTEDGPDFKKLDEVAGELELRVDDPYFIPHLAGRVSPNMSSLRGSWANLNWNHNQSHMYRAVLESVALEYTYYKNTLQQMYPSLATREIRMTGGGSYSRYWNSLKADALGMPAVRVSRSEGAPLGAAIIAAWSAGFFSHPAQAAGQWIATAGSQQPDTGHSGHYAERYGKYLSLIEHMNQWAEQ